ncbi:hypothetical protein SAMN05216410_0779 [Sanguibacter gelidistatuariae]|uniref:Copper(I)-binding protein n=1 Tax=Sanguibacter gelidistatuariae TaxID=1814289 RepID=A0A1G6H6A1_9MICO|nr:copper chaperone PCu(A)C [Sanguibacter gelidistatuariae]SDB89799.1 hypothetical protein SAMN05216410_0779 [Sanguibacter gelidistatuariae]
MKAPGGAVAPATVVRLAMLVSGIGVSLLLAGCGTDEPATHPGSTHAGAAATGMTDPDAPPQADSLTVTDPWTKAAEDGMTASFGVLHNSGTSDVRVVGASTSTAAIELHEMVTGADGAMTMSEVEGGFLVPAGGERTLAPGGEHLMLMAMTAPVEAGTDLEITLELEDGSTLVYTAPGRTYAGANESYDEGMDMGHGDDTGGAAAAHASHG